MALQLVTGEIARTQMLKVAYAAWARGDVSNLLSLAADDCEFTLMGNLALNPHSGTRLGVGGLTQALKDFHNEFTMLDMVVEKIIVDGDDAAVLWHARIEVKSTGRVFDGERFDCLEFRGDKVVKVRGFFDSATMALLTGRATVSKPPEPIKRKSRA
jgi:ketosteroid isomerase-like protein